MDRPSWNEWSQSLGEGLHDKAAVAAVAKGEEDRFDAMM